MFLYSGIYSIFFFPVWALVLVSYVKFWKNLEVVDLDYPSSKKNFESCSFLANQNKWKKIYSDSKTIIIETPASGFTSFGERVTILFDQPSMRINSRPSPSRRFSVATFGRNKMNVESVKKVCVRS
jgi:hypothetical protein